MKRVLISSAIPSAICLLDEDQRKRLAIVQQARPEDKDTVSASYAKLGLPAEVSPFFGDMPAKIANANLVICRSGASTVSELAVIGRPSVLVPYPYALDHDQAANAAALKAKGGAEVIAQSALSPEKLSKIIRTAMAEPAHEARRHSTARSSASARPGARPSGPLICFRRSHRIWCLRGHDARRWSHGSGDDGRYDSSPRR